MGDIFFVSGQAPRMAEALGVRPPEKAAKSRPGVPSRAARPSGPVRRPPRRSRERARLRAVLYVIAAGAAVAAGGRWAGGGDPTATAALATLALGMLALTAPRH
jgi:hypothetical protein